MDKLSRRQAVGALAAMIGAVQLPALAEARMRRTRLAGRLGIQLYMLAEEAAKDLSGTLRRVHEIGYREVEVASFHGLSARQLRTELDKAGLSCTSVHTAFEPFMHGSPNLTDVPGAIASFQALGATNAVVAIYPFLKSLIKRPDAGALFADQEKAAAAIAEIGQKMTAEEWLAFAHDLNEKGALLNKAGIRIGYHNHNVEFVKLANGQTAFDLLIAHTDPALVDFELDIGWAASAGHDPVALIKRHERRITQLHLKDVAAGTASTNLGIHSVDLGKGIVDWKHLLALLPGSDVRHVYVEQEPPFIAPPIEAARTAYQFLAPRMTEARA
jgi:sugar phosphate isomerase/epimerase